jgi:predicted DNA binding CopG/RHH family protein
MEVKMKEIKLTPDEQYIEDHAEEFVSVNQEKKKNIDSILEKAKKNRAISLRISNFDLDLLKSKAQKEGIPYQTLINAIIHKYVTNQLLEKEEALKILQLTKQ